MEGKPVENQGPPPSFTDVPTIITEVPPAQCGHSQRHANPPMFITARTSVYGPVPVELDCPFCHAHIVTHIERVAGLLPWLVLGACVILGFFLLCIPWCFCCIPFFVDKCLDVIHSCPACKIHLGRYSRV